MLPICCTSIVEAANMLYVCNFLFVIFFSILLIQVLRIITFFFDYGYMFYTTEASKRASVIVINRSFDKGTKSVYKKEPSGI